MPMCFFVSRAKERMTGTPFGMECRLFSSIVSYARGCGMSTAGCQPNWGRYRQYFRERSNPLLPAWGGKWYAIISTFPKGSISLYRVLAIPLKWLHAVVCASLHCSILQWRPESTQTSEGNGWLRNPTGLADLP